MDSSESVETLPCGHPAWLAQEPQVVIQANRLLKFYKARGRFPIWNVYSLSVFAAALVLFRVCQFLNVIAADIFLFCLVAVSLGFAYKVWDKARNDPFEEA